MRFSIISYTLSTCIALVIASIMVQPSALAATTGLDKVLAAPDWLNGKPTAQMLHGKVVLVDFYTFNCFNCQNVEPNLRKLYQDQTRGNLIILAVHSPETGMERNRANLVSSLKSQGVQWPVAVDNDFALWNAYGITAWPTQLIFDRSGHLRKTVIGDSQDAVVDATIDQLIRQP